jgi:hypothetical protein
MAAKVFSFMANALRPSSYFEKKQGANVIKIGGNLPQYLYFLRLKFCSTLLWYLNLGHVTKLLPW